MARFPLQRYFLFLSLAVDTHEGHERRNKLRHRPPGSMRARRLTAAGV